MKVEIELTPDQFDDIFTKMLQDDYTVLCEAAYLYEQDQKESKFYKRLKKAYERVADYYDVKLEKPAYGGD